MTPLAAQRHRALEKANRVKVDRKLLKCDVRNGASLREIILDPPDCARTATALEALTWPKWHGEGKAIEKLRWAGVNASKRLGELSERERLSLVEQLRLAGVA